MSDVFISYARSDQKLARALAKDLEALGYSVWWDAELVGSDDFYDVILAALSKARAAIVIWSNASVSSRFVRDEARFALHKDKLVATKTDDLDVFQIPFGFQGQHTDLITNREQIVKAINKLGVTPSPTSRQQPKPSTAFGTPDGTDTDGLLALLDRHPTGPEREWALQRLRALLEDGDSIREFGRNESNVFALVQGFTFTFPRFQSRVAGTYSSIGFALGIVLLVVGGFAGTVYLFPLFNPEIPMSVASPPLLVLGWMQFRAWVKQRNFVAAFILTALNTVLMLISGVAFVIYVFDVPGSAFIPFPHVAAASLLLYSLWKMWRAR